MEQDGSVTVSVQCTLSDLQAGLDPSKGEGVLVAAAEPAPTAKREHQQRVNQASGPACLSQATPQPPLLPWRLPFTHLSRGKAGDRVGRGPGRQADNREGSYEHACPPLASARACLLPSEVMLADHHHSVTFTGQPCPLTPALTPHG